MALDPFGIFWHHVSNLPGFVLLPLDVLVIGCYVAVSYVVKVPHTSGEQSETIDAK